VRMRKEMLSAFVKPDEEEDKDRHLIGALSRGLEILRAFEQSNAPLSNQDLVACTGLPKSTVSRITRTLTIEGFLVHLPRSGAYRLAPAVLALARAFHTSTGIAEIAQPHMQELADTIRGTVAMGTRDRLDIVYMQICRGVKHVRVPQTSGTRVPIATTAIGNAYFHTVAPDEREALTALIKRQSQRTWQVIADELERTGREIAKGGFCVRAGSWTPGINGVGAALRLPDQTVVAFNVGGPSYWLKEEALYEDIGPRLVDMARNVLADAMRRGVLMR